MIKIKAFCFKGFRGIREQISLDLKSKSLLCFGTNGAGKSSITDAFEWFYKGSVEHLSSAEIDRKGGLTALRNTFIADTESCSVKIDFTDSNLNSEKNIALRESNYEVGNSNKSDELNAYIEGSKHENLILRYKDLIGFVLSTKKEKLDSLSKVIGIEEVTSTRMIFKKAVNEVNSNLRSKSYDNEISNREGQIIEQFNERLVSDEQYIKKINETIEPLDMSINIEKLEDIDVLLSKFKKTDDSTKIEERAFLKSTINSITDFQSRIDNLLISYDSYYQSFQNIVQDIETLKKLSLRNLLSEGLRVLKGSVVVKDECPLCLQAKSKEDLISEIEVRLKTLGSVEKEKDRLDDAKMMVQTATSKIGNLITGIRSNKYSDNPENQNIVNFCQSVNAYIDTIEGELAVNIFKIRKIKPKKEIEFDTANISNILDFCKKRDELLEKAMKGKKILEIQEKITLSRQVYKEITRLKKEKKILEQQRESLEAIYNAFVQKQKEELEIFISSYSKEIDKYYQYLHPGEKVDNIEIKTIEKDDELTGITINFNFFNKQVFPPQKYLSESHLNSLGICFFLASVKAFNKVNRFFILDDLISSFDSDHRKRLGDMLLGEFSDYQIFVMTHERNWFDYMKNIVKGKSDWVITAVNWNEPKGVHFDPTLVDLRITIEKKLTDNDVTGLGNIIRMYLERLLKDICEAVEVNVKYRSNEFNEDRMSNELLSNLKSKINKQPGKNIFGPIIDKMLPSVFVGNKGSHDSNFRPSVGECRAFWQDVQELEKLFCCSICMTMISTKFYDPVNKQIRCKHGNESGHLCYDWKT